MKHTISKLFLLLVAAVAMAACTDTDVPELATYPAQETLDNWTSDYIESGASYAISITTNEQGDTICNFTMTDPETGQVSALQSSDLSYDKAVGMSVINFSTSPYSRMPMRIYLSRRHTLDAMNVQIFTVETYNGSEYETLEAAFNATSHKGAALQGFVWNNDEASVSLLFDDDKNFTYEIGEEEGQGTYTYNVATGEGTLTFADGTTATISFNAANQMVFTRGSQSVKLFVVY